MNTSEAARALLVTTEEVRDLMRRGSLPHQFRNGRYHIDARDLESLRERFPDKYQPAPEELLALLDLIWSATCADLAQALEAFRPVFEREDLEGLLYRAKRAGYASAAERALWVVEEALFGVCREASVDLARFGVVTVLLEAVGRPLQTVRIGDGWRSTSIAKPARAGARERRPAWSPSSWTS